MHILFLCLLLSNLCYCYSWKIKYTSNCYRASCSTYKFRLNSNNGEEVISTPSIAKIEGLDLLEIRVGRIVQIDKHPEADSLYVEQVDLGETTGPRTIVSGLVEYCTIEEMLNRYVVVLCNLKPRAIKGITSNGMLLCASDKDNGKVDPLTPSSNTIIGELITFEGYAMKPVEPGNKASKVFSKIADDFFVNDENLASFNNIPFMTSQGTIQCSLKGKIS